MIYLVSKNEELFKEEEYVKISPEEAISILYKESILGADTETEGFDPYTKKLLTIQLGTEEFQVVWDCLSYNVQLLKSLLEDPNIMTIWWNAKFDLKFLYHNNIWPNNVYDGMIAEELMYLGYPAGTHNMSLKGAGERYCNVELDKSVRGKIVTCGLISEVVKYAAYDVKYEIPIYKAQQKALKEKDLLRAVKFENEFVKVLAYIEYCGVKLDVPRWKKKMKNDSYNADMFIKSMNNWIYASENKQKTCICYIDTYNRGKDIDDDRKNPYYQKRVPEMDVSFPEGASFEAYEVEVFSILFEKSHFFVNTQGDLFNGFNTEPICDINWSSSKQVIPLLEDLGFNVMEFDKKEKKYKKSASGKVIAKQLYENSFALMYCKYKLWKKRCESFGQNYIDAINSVTGRIHTNFFQFGTDTARLSSGGKPYNINLQQLPRDAETRACFTVENGNSWVTADYDGQESFITADITQDPTLLEVFTTGCKDMHNIIAKAAFPEQLKDCDVADVKKRFPDLRQKAKGIEFTIYYGGDYNTLAGNMNISKDEAKKIYNSVMNGLPGLKKYQDYCRKIVMELGYILLCPVTGHKAFIYDFNELKVIRDKLKDPEFNSYYWEMKNSAPDCDTVKSVKHYYRRKSDSEKQCIDYKVQGRGSMCFKLSSIILFNYIKNNNLLMKVKYVIPVHDK